MGVILQFHFAAFRKERRGGSVRLGEVGTGGEGVRALAQDAAAGDAQTERIAEAQGIHDVRDLKGAREGGGVHHLASTRRAFSP